MLLKTACKELSHPMFLIWRASLDQGVIPPDLLLVLISPVHKGGSRGMPANYRPVALTSHLTKVFERVVRRLLVNHLEVNDLLPARIQSKAVLPDSAAILLGQDTGPDGGG